MSNAFHRTPVEVYLERRHRLVLLAGLLAMATLALFIYWRWISEVPVDYADDADHFAYGSIGSDSYSGIPYWIWRVLPEVFPDHLPQGDKMRRANGEIADGLTGYQQFGFIIEEGADRPVGFSRRRVLVDRVGLNCAVCHTGTLRVTGGMDPDRVYGAPPRYVSSNNERIVILGMPAHTVDLARYFKFLFDAVDDPRFTADVLLSYIDERTDLSTIDRILYRLSVAPLRETLLLRRRQLNDLFGRSDATALGPGRIDTFNPYKRIQFGFAHDDSIGTADFPSLWNQRPRTGMRLHWDGNNSSVFERNISASLGAGATPVGLDFPRMLRMAAWTGSPDPRWDVDLSAAEREAFVREARVDPFPAADELQVPAFPFSIDTAAAGRGRVVYDAQCASCHAFTGEYVGTVVPLADIGTDPERFNSYTTELSTHQGTLGAGQWWRFEHFRKTDGYANMPLDGIWARAPYLHNGSVPTLWDLLQVVEQRPTDFYRGDDAYDPVKVGFRSDRPVSDDGRNLFWFDTTLPGNGNGGHLYGTNLSEPEKDDLLVYLKTLGGRTP